MKNTLIIFFVFITKITFSQVITVYANQEDSVILIFDKPIKQGLPGSKNYYFAYDRKKPDLIGTLNAKKNAPASNLFVVTTDGQMYSIIIKYKENITNKDHTNIIPVSSSIQNIKKEKQAKLRTVKVQEKNNPVDLKIKKESAPISTDNYDYHHKEDNFTEKEYLELCKKILKNDQLYFRNKFRVQEKVFFSLKNYYYHKEELYFYFELENQSKIDFDVNLLNFFIENRKKKKRTLSQRVFLGEKGLPDFSYNVPKRVKSGDKSNFICVFKKFSINSDKVIIVSLSELKGERVIELKLLSKTINNPQTTI